jgi:hypothetical protein
MSEKRLNSVSEARNGFIASTFIYQSDRFGLSCTGLKTFHPAIVILFSMDKERLACVRDRITKALPHVDDEVLAPGNGSRDHIFQLLRTSKNISIPRGDDNFFTQYLIERSALVIK